SHRLNPFHTTPDRRAGGQHASRPFVVYGASTTMTTNAIHTRKHTLDLFSTPADGPPAASDEGRQWTQVFSVRLVRERALDTPIVTTPADVARVFSEYLDGCDREHFVVALLSTRAQLIGLHTCHVGALSSCIVSIRDVFKVALLANAASIVVGHNHPSGNLEPSREDIRITKKLAEA